MSTSRSAPDLLHAGARTPSARASARHPSPGNFLTWRRESNTLPLPSRWYALGGGGEEEEEERGGGAHGRRGGRETGEGGKGEGEGLYSLDTERLDASRRFAE